MPVTFVRIALWLIQAFAVIAVSVTAALGRGWIIVTDQVGDHVWWAFAAMVTLVASHIGVIFYIIGARRILREAKTTLGFEADPALMREHEAVVRRTMPFAAVGVLTLMIAFILGGAADTGAISITTHGLIAITAAVINIVAMFWEMGSTQANHLILQRLRVDEIAHQNVATPATP